MHFLTFSFSKIVDFWSFLKLQKMKFSQKKILKLIYVITRVFLAWTVLNFLAHCASDFARVFLNRVEKIFSYDTFFNLQSHDYHRLRWQFEFRRLLLF